jgi:hypothetical protein
MDQELPEVSQAVNDNGGDVGTRTVESRGEGVLRPNTGNNPLRQVGSGGGLSRMVRTPLSPQSRGGGEDVFAVLCSPTDVAPIVEADLVSIFPSETPQPPPGGEEDTQPPASKPPRPHRPHRPPRGSKAPLHPPPRSSNVGGRPGAGKRPLSKQPPPPKRSAASKPKIPIFAPSTLVSTSTSRSLTTGKYPAHPTAQKPPAKIPLTRFQRNKREKSLERSALATALKAAADEQLAAVEPDEASERDALEDRERCHRSGVLTLLRHDLATHTIPKVLRAMTARHEPRGRQEVELEELEARACTLHRYYTYGIITVRTAEEHHTARYEELVNHTIDRQVVRPQPANKTTASCESAELVVVPQEEALVDALPPPSNATSPSRWGPSYATKFGDPSVDEAPSLIQPPEEDDEEGEAPPPPPPRRIPYPPAPHSGVGNDRLFMELESVRLAFEGSPTRSLAHKEYQSTPVTPARFKLPDISRGVVAASADAAISVRPTEEVGVSTAPIPPPRATDASPRSYSSSYLPSIPMTPATARLFPSAVPPPDAKAISLPSLMARSALDHKRIRGAFSEARGGAAGQGAMKYNYIASSPRKPAAAAEGGSQSTRPTYESRLQAALSKLDGSGTKPLDAVTSGYVSLLQTTPLCDDEALTRKILERRIEPKERAAICEEISRQMQLALAEEALRRDNDKHVIRCDESRLHSRRVVSALAVSELHRYVILPQLESAEALARSALHEAEELVARGALYRMARVERIAIQQGAIIQDEEPLGRARIEWMWGVQWCPPNLTTTPCPTAIEDVFPYSAVEAKYRTRRILQGGSGHSHLPPLLVGVQGDEDRFVILQEKEQRRLLELSQFQSFRVNLLTYPQRVLNPQLEQSALRDASARTIQRKFRAIRLGVSGWRHSHRQLGGTIRVQRLQKERIRAKERTAAMLLESVS